MARRFDTLPAEMRAALDDPGFTVGDDTLVVAQAFRLVTK